MLLQLRLRRALLSSRVGLLQLLVPPRASAIREPSACTPKINAPNPLFKLLLQVELLRGEEMSPPEIVQLIAWSKE
jgi:hypothetical protein